MATMVFVWSKAKIASHHPHAGIITPGKNRMEDKLAHRIINEGGEIVAYTGQDNTEQDKGRVPLKKHTEELSSSFRKKKKYKLHGGND